MFDVLTSVIEVYCLLECDPLQHGISLLTFWRNELPPSSGLNDKPSSLLFLAYSSNLKIEAVRSTEILVNVFQTTENS
jgi:hypothetical protein